MSRFLLLAVLALLHANSFGAVYKCVREGGNVEYQATPCPNGREVAIKATQPDIGAFGQASAAPGNRRKCVGNEVRITFSNMPVKSTLAVLADFSGNKLAADATVTGSGAFDYQCVPWDVVLHDIASRYSLAVKVENGTIFVSKR